MLENPYQAPQEKQSIPKNDNRSCSTGVYWSGIFFRSLGAPLLGIVFGGIVGGLLASVYFFTTTLPSEGLFKAFVAAIVFFPFGAGLYSYFGFFTGLFTIPLVHIFRQWKPLDFISVVSIVGLFGRRLIGDLIFGDLPYKEDVIYSMIFLGFTTGAIVWFLGRPASEGNKFK